MVALEDTRNYTGLGRSLTSSLRGRTASVYLDSSALKCYMRCVSQEIRGRKCEVNECPNGALENSSSPGREA